MNKGERTPRRSRSLDAILLGTALAALPPEGTPAIAQTVLPGMSWQEGAGELERFAREETPEGVAVYLAFGEESGTFIDLVNEPNIVRASTAIFYTPETLASAIGRAYRPDALQPEARHLRIFMVHTHPAAIVSQINLLGPVFVRLAERQVPITVAPSPTDTRNSQHEASFPRAIRQRFPGIAADQVSLEYAVIDPLVTYHYRPLTGDERTARGLPQRESVHEDLSTPWGQFTLVLRETLGVIDGMDTLTKARLAGMTTEQSLEDLLILDSPAVQTLYTVLQEQGREILAGRLQHASREYRAYNTTLEIDYVRGHWATFVADSLDRHQSWDTILRSDEYAHLRDFYARYENVDLRVVPNEQTRTQPPFETPTVSTGR